VDPASLPEVERAPLALASTQGEALDALEASPLAGELLGPEIVDAVLAVRRYEQRTYGDADPEAVAAVCRLAFSC
jgi:glutamine synthetase